MFDFFKKERRGQAKERKVKRKKEGNRIMKSIKSKRLKIEMPPRCLNESPFEEHSRFVTELAQKEIKDSFEYSSLSPEEKERKLKEIGASSAWGAYYDLKAFPPRENYNDNENFFENVPYLKECIDLRAQMSVGVGLELRDDQEDEETPQEIFLNNEYKRLKIPSKIHKGQIHDDLYGNSYTYLEWMYDKKGIKKTGLKNVKTLQPTRIRIRLSPEEGNPVTGFVWAPPQLIIGQVPIPIPIPVDEMMHVQGDDYDDIPYGYSKIFGIKQALQARWDINVLLPILFRQYAKPWIHFKVDREGIDDNKIASIIDDMSTLLEQTGPDSDLITSNRIDSSVFSGNQAMKHPIELIDDVDNQIFGQLTVPETYFKAKGSTDRMILKQDDNFIRAMRQIQEKWATILTEKLNKPLLEAKFGSQFKLKQVTELDENGIEVTKTVKEEKYKIPEVKWKEIFEEDKNQLYERESRLFEKGLSPLNETRKMINREALDDTEMEELNNQRTALMGEIPEEPMGSFEQDASGAQPLGLNQDGNFPEDSTLQELDGGDFKIKISKKERDN